MRGIDGSIFRAYFFYIDFIYGGHNMKNTKTINKSEKTYHDAFYEAFKSIQLSGAYTIYYELNFSKDELKEFNELLRKNNDKELQHVIQMKELESNIHANYNFDCVYAAAEFPYRAKLKMYGKKIIPKNVATIVAGTTDAIRFYLVLSIYTLVENYRFDEDMVKIFYEKLKEFCKLYADGLQNADVLKYFIQECDLKITEG